MRQSVYLVALTWSSCSISSFAASQSCTNASCRERASHPASVEFKLEMVRVASSGVSRSSQRSSICSDARSISIFEYEIYVYNALPCHLLPAGTETLLVVVDGLRSPLECSSFCWAQNAIWRLRFLVAPEDWSDEQSFLSDSSNDLPFFLSLISVLWSRGPSLSLFSLSSSMYSKHQIGSTCVSVSQEPHKERTCMWLPFW